MELNLIRTMKNIEKRFYKYSGQRREAPSVMVTHSEKQKGETAIQGTEKAEVLSKFSVSVFTDSQASHNYHISKPLKRG